jgi:hypothetical protein
MYRLASSNVTRGAWSRGVSVRASGGLAGWSRVGPRNRPLAVKLDRHIYHRSALRIGCPDRLGHRVGIIAPVLKRLEFHAATVEAWILWAIFRRHGAVLMDSTHGVDVGARRRARSA